MRRDGGDRAPGGRLAEEACAEFDLWQLGHDDIV
jgi:hypothetical protein